MKHSEKRANWFIILFSFFIIVLILFVIRFYINSVNTEPMQMPINHGLKLLKNN